jgi:hypothetical protein
MVQDVIDINGDGICHDRMGGGNKLYVLVYCPYFFWLYVNHGVMGFNCVEVS